MDFQTFFNTKLKESGFSLRRLSEVSGIALKHLENLNFGDFGELPSEPYLRGYFIKLGQILDFDGEEVLKEFRKETSIVTSGDKDQLPKNRFAKKSPPKKLWLVLVIVIAIAIVVIWRLPQIIGQPQITIFSPSQDFLSVNTNTILIRGELKGGDKLKINNEDIIISQDGAWQKRITLEEGLNTIEISAEKFLGRETKIIRQILFEPPKETTPTETEEL